LRRLSIVRPENLQTSKSFKALTNEINWIRNHFGDDYLDKILKRVDNQKNEVIIAVENKHYTIK
jgi:DNA-binding TFAR19-related protein (PDSD5 family)